MTCVLLVKFVGRQSAGGLVGESDKRFSAFDSFLDIHGNVLNMICSLALRFFWSFRRTFQETFVENTHLKFYNFGFNFLTF